MVSELQKACDAFLIKNLPAGLKAAIDRLLAKGVAKASVLKFVRAKIVEAGGQPRGLTGLAVESYLGCDQEGRLP